MPTPASAVWAMTSIWWTAPSSTSLAYLYSTDYDVLVEKKDGHLVVRPNIRLGELAHSAKEMTLKGNKAYLRISSDGAYYYMQASADGKMFETLAKMDFRYLSTEVIGGFTGVMLGVFAQGESLNGFADFDWLEYCSFLNSL